MRRPRAKLAKHLDEDFEILGPRDVEHDMGVFTRHEGPVTLLIANRYEGIDLPGDDCRLMALCHVPSGATLQERYMLARLGAVAPLRDRIRTRVTQAMGRCTRDESDYAIVLVFGDDLVKWFSTKANLRGMHPELQAEIEFGFKNSVDNSAETVLELIEEFLKQSEEWRAAHDSIKVLRATHEKEADPMAEALAEVAAREIDYQHHLWNGAYDQALAAAVEITDGLEGGSELRPYRSFWHHLAATAAFLAWRHTGDESYRRTAIDRLSKASSTSVGLRWLGSLRVKLAGSGTEPATEDERPVQDWFLRIEELLAEWRLAGSRFSKRLAEVERDLRDVEDAAAFERGLAGLGRMLGARIHRWDGSGKPDGLWAFGDWNAVVFEAKSEERPGAVCLATVRQARTHETTARADGEIADHVPCTTAVVSRHTALRPDAAPHVGGLKHLDAAAVLRLFRAAANALREVRGRAAGVDGEALQELAQEAYKKHRVFMSDVMDLLSAVRLGDMPPA